MPTETNARRHHHNRRADPAAPQRASGADNDYPEGSRFAWDLITLTHAEVNEMCDYIEAEDDKAAEAVINRAENRLFHDA